MADVPDRAALDRLLGFLDQDPLNPSLLRDAAMQTLSTVGMIVWIGIGATAIVGVYNLMGGVNFVSGMITGISDNPTVIVLVMMLILFLQSTGILS